MQRSYGLILLLLALALTSSCHVNDKSEVVLDDCDGDLLRAKDSTTLSSLNKRSWDTSTDTAAGSCTTIYHVWFRWAHDVDAQNSPDPPDVFFSFIPSARDTVIKPTRFSGKPPGFGATSDKGWWMLSVPPAPTTKSGNTTPFHIYATLDQLADDDVEVYTEILYRHSPN